MSKTPKKATRAALVAELRKRMVCDTERGGRVVGHVCELCGSRWRGKAERHYDECILAGEIA